jgi:hypothetical protein
MPDSHLDLGLSPPAVIPIKDLENIAKLAADHAVAQALARAPSKEEVEQIAKKAASEAAQHAGEEELSVS